MLEREGEIKLRHLHCIDNRTTGAATLILLLLNACIWLASYYVLISAKEEETTSRWLLTEWDTFSVPLYSMSFIINVHSFQLNCQFHNFQRSLNTGLKRKELDWHKPFQNPSLFSAKARKKDHLHKEKKKPLLKSAVLWRKYSALSKSKIHSKDESKSCVERG